MKKFLTICAAVLILSSCGSKGSNTATGGSDAIVGKVPTACEIAGVISEFDAQVPGSKFVPTEWQPAPNTDLEAALSNNGIACTYGIQVAEVGGTILWASNADNVWDTRKQVWIKDGYTVMDLPGIDETEAYVLQEGKAADEMHFWQANMLVNGVWIQVGASFLQNLDEALPILKAAVAATK